MSEEGNQAAVAGLARDDAFELLGHPYRRALLTCLREHGESLTLADVAEEVACTVSGDPLTDIDAEVVKRVYMSLYHSHVPKLVEYDVVHYEQERDLITPTERVEPLGEYVAQLDG